MNCRILWRNRRVRDRRLACRSVHAAGGDPLEIAMRGDRGVGLIKVAINVRVAGEGVCLCAVGEIVNVFRPDDVNEFQGGLAAA
jgi:hypothetical protein